MRLSSRKAEWVQLLFGEQNNPELENQVRREVAEGPGRLARTLNWLEDYFWPFRLFGLLLIVVAGLYFLLFWMLINGQRLRGGSIWGVVPIVCPLVGIGIGLYLRQRWAAGLFAGICFALSSWLGIGSLIALFDGASILVLLNLPHAWAIGMAGMIVRWNWHKLGRRAQAD